MNPIDTPFFRPLLRDVAFVAAQIEGCTRGPVRGLHLDQARATTRIKGQDVVTCAVAVLCGDPPNSAGEIRPVGLGELATLEIDDE